MLGKLLVRFREGLGCNSGRDEILWHRRGSGQQGRESSGVKVPMPSVARFGRLAYPLLGEVTNRDMRGRKSHGCPVCR